MPLRFKTPLSCREAHTALAMDGLKVGDRQIRCSLAKSDQRPALPPPPQAMPMLGQPFNLMQAQAQARLMQQLPAFNMLLGPLPGVQAAPVVDSRGKAAQRPPQDPDRVARTIFVESVADNMNEQVGHGLCPANHATALMGPCGRLVGYLPLCNVPAVHLCMGQGRCASVQWQRVCFATYGRMTDMPGPFLRTCCAEKAHACCVMSLPPLSRQPVLHPPCRQLQSSSQLVEKSLQCACRRRQDRKRLGWSLTPRMRRDQQGNTTTRCAFQPQSYIALPLFFFRPASLFARRTTTSSASDCQHLLATLPTMHNTVCLPLAMPCPPAYTVALFSVSDCGQ